MPYLHRAILKAELIPVAFELPPASCKDSSIARRAGLVNQVTEGSVGQGSVAKERRP